MDSWTALSRAKPVHSQSEVRFDESLDDQLSSSAMESLSWETRGWERVGRLMERVW